MEAALTTRIEAAFKRPVAGTYIDMCLYSPRAKVEMICLPLSANDDHDAPIVLTVRARHVSSRESYGGRDKNCGNAEQTEVSLSGSAAVEQTQQPPAHRMGAGGAQLPRPHHHPRRLQQGLGVCERIIRRPSHRPVVA